VRKAIPSDDELELVALDFLRQRFLRTDERMAELLATLESQVDAAPAQERLSLRNAADQIAEIQQRLRAQMGNLPQGDKRRQLLRSLLQVQSGALQQVSDLVERNTRQQAKAARPKRTSLTKPRGASEAGRALANAHVMRSSANTTPAIHHPLGRLGWRRVAIVELMRSHRLTVVGAIAVAAFYAYMHLPSAYFFPRETVRDRPTTTEAGGTPEPPKYPSSLADADDKTDRKSMPQFPGIVITRRSGGAADTAALPTGPSRMQQLEGTRGDEPAEPGRGAPLPMVLPPSLGARQARNAAAGDEQDSASSPARKPATPAGNGEDRAAKPEPSRFVAVVFTHREPASAIREFAELQQRYPRVLAQRKGEAQPVEIAEKGTWHRLVILPAGSRQSADRLCDQLVAAGYDRCWVKPY
jgi:hypothetical protein